MSDIKTMLGGGKEALVAAKTLGLGALSGMDAKGNMSDEMRIKFQKQLDVEGKKNINSALNTVGFMDPKVSKELNNLQQGNISFDELSSDAAAAWNTATGTSAAGLAGASKMNAAASGSAGGNTGDALSLDLMKQTGAGQQAKEFESGKVNLNDLAAKFDLIAEAANPTKMAEAVSKAAKDMTAPAALMDKAGTKMNTAADKFLSAMDKMGVGGIDTPKTNTKAPSAPKIQTNFSGKQ